jgi:hypothetical protein
VAGVYNDAERLSRSVYAQGPLECCPDGQYGGWSVPSTDQSRYCVLPSMTCGVLSTNTHGACISHSGATYTPSIYPTAAVFVVFIS